MIIIIIPPIASASDPPATEARQGDDWPARSASRTRFDDAAFAMDTVAPPFLLACACARVRATSMS